LNLRLWTVDIPGLVVNGVAAAGTVAAAVAALAIATKDRRERRKERRAADRAQARLVLIEATTHPDSILYRIDVHNHGAQPILDVTIGRVTLPGHLAHWKLRDDAEPIIRIIRPETQEAFHSFAGEFINPDGSPNSGHTRDSYNIPHYDSKPEPGLITATVTFTDVNANLWRVDTDGHLERTGTAS
jgi:hypothetical protein